MVDDPIDERRRLAEVYSEKWDDELRELGAEFDDLTEMAQQALHAEMKKRGLGVPGLAGQSPDPLAVPRPLPDLDQPDDPEPEQESDLPREYTWKTVLCECDSQEEAWQVREVLRRAGIETWVEKPRFSFDLSSPRVLVAADQLDHAREVAASPIPQEIVDLSKVDVPVFETPACPDCGAPDPVLESVEPVNAWKCEACGKEWAEPPEMLDDEPERSGP